MTEHEACDICFSKNRPCNCGQYGVSDNKYETALKLLDDLLSYHPDITISKNAHKGYLIHTGLEEIELAEDLNLFDTIVNASRSIL